MMTFDYARLAGSWPSQLAKQVALLEEYLETARKRELRKSPGLDLMHGTAAVQGVQASCSLDGIRVDAERLEALAKGSLQPADEAEREALGLYRATMEVCSDPLALDVAPDTLLALHRTVEGGAHAPLAGRFRQEQDSLAEACPMLAGMDASVILAAGEVPGAVEAWCRGWREASERGDVSGVRLALAAAADLACIVPFPRGSGLMSRLTAVLLLGRAGCPPFLAAMMSAALDGLREFYEPRARTALAGWRKERKASAHLASVFFLGFATGCGMYAGMGEMMEGMAGPVLERIKMQFSRLGADAQKVFSSARGAKEGFTSAEAAAVLPDRSMPAVRAVLRELREAGAIERTGAGRSTRYQLSELWAQYAEALDCCGLDPESGR